jgi:hypothetical protein
MNLLLFESRRGAALPVLQPLPKTAITQRRNPTTRWSRLQDRIRTTYRRLEERFDYDERLCSALRQVPELKVRHSTRMDSEAARKLLHRFFVRQRLKHSAWLKVDVVLAGLGSLLTPIPGPNIFFFYPAIRAFGHYTALRGARDAGRLVRLSFAPEPLIDQVQLNLDRIEKLRPLLVQLEQQYNLTDLERRLFSRGARR